MHSVPKKKPGIPPRIAPSVNFSRLASSVTARSPIEEIVAVLPGQIGVEPKPQRAAMTLRHSFVEGLLNR